MIEKIMKILNKVKAGAATDADAELLDSGAIDSFDVVDLVAELEKEFGVQIDGGDVAPENFATPRAIAKMLEKYIQI